MVEWSTALDNAPIYLHEADRGCVMRPHPNIRFWRGEGMTLLESLFLIHTPGHFDGFQVLHWPSGADGKGVLFSGDQPQVCMDTRWVSFMYSYPNFIPLSISSIRNIVRALEPFSFDRIYGAFPKRTVRTGAEQAVKRSADRYIRACESRKFTIEDAAQG
jgi:glyoxylase-like metal-dependent hydrolase (beta-lactamase superfamily II)